MARRRAKKSLSLHDDKFRQSIFSFAGFVSEYKYVLLLGAAVIVMFSVAFYLRSERKARRFSYTAKILASDVKVSPDELKELVETTKGDPLEPWVWMAYGNRLFETYQEEDILKGDKSKLLLAQKAFEQVRDRFPKNGSAYFCALKSLEVVKEELEFKLEEEQPEKTEQPGGKVEEEKKPSSGQGETPPPSKEKTTP